MDDCAEMLRWLADQGWKPVLYPETDLWSRVMHWVCYPESDVRAWRSFRAPDPVAAVRGLYRHAQTHPDGGPRRPYAAADCTVYPMP